MKNITILLAFIFAFNSWSVAPYGIKGQKQSGTLYSNVHQFPNNLVTNTGGINALVETGNNNILVNPSFEHLTASTGWTLTAGTLTENLVNEIHGLKAASIALSAQTLNLTQDSTLYASEFAGSVQGLASVRIKTSVAGLKVCARQAGVTSTSLCVDVQANNQWGLYKVPFILSATSNGIAITTSSAVTGTVLVDDAFVGAVDLKADSQNVLKGSLSYAKTANCAFATSSTSYASFGADTDCPTASVNGIVSAPGTKLAGFVLPAGTVGRVLVQASVYSSPATSTIGPTTGRLRLTDGTNNYGDNFAAYTAGTGSGILNGYFGQTFEFTITSPLTAATTYQLQGLTTNASNTLNVNGTDYNIEFYVSVYPSNSGTSTYSSLNADTDWAACNFSTLAWQGLGTVTNNLQCKRHGSDLVMRGRFTVGAPSASEARIPLPLWNGSQLSTTAAIATTEMAGFAHRNALTTTQYGILSEASVAYLTMDAQSGGTAGLTKQNGSTLFGTGDIVSFTARVPIAGWQNSNIIIGQFNGLESCTDSYECTDVFSAKISIAGIVSDENINWINGNASLSSAVYTMTFNSGVFTVAPNCTATTSTSGQLAASIRVESISPTQIQLVPSYAGGAGNNPQVIDQAFHIHCQKQGVDYIGKTAKAVASDQNLRTPGVTKAIKFGASFTSGAVISNNEGGIITSATCTTGSWTISLTGLASAPSRCFIQNTGITADVFQAYSVNKTLTQLTFVTRSNGAGTSCQAIDVECSGVTP